MHPTPAQLRSVDALFDDRGAIRAATDGALRLYEVAPRDGLQNEQARLGTAQKVELIAGLVAAGVSDVEVCAFVHPVWVPQMADAEQVVSALPAVAGVRYWGLVPNLRGLDRAESVGLDHIAVVMSTSETHNQKNLNRSRDQKRVELQGLIGRARSDDLRVRAYLSTAFGCPYEGALPLHLTVDLALALWEAGAQMIALGDTTGMATPLLVTETVQALTARGLPAAALALHLHDTRGTALVNAYAGWQAGVRIVDAAVAGVGGCPYAPGAAGNVASDDVVQLMNAMGIAVRTGDRAVALADLADVGCFLSKQLGRSLPGRYHRFHAGGCAPSPS